MAGKHGNYSNVIIYDERRRYYYLWPQRNKPLLDDEIRDMGVGLLDQVRRAVQHTFGDVAVPTNVYASSAIATSNAFQVVQSATPTNNFLLKGGTVGGGSLDHPAVLYAKGYYIFLVNDIEYTDQDYSSATIDLNVDTGETSNKYKTLTLIPELTTPITDRLDIVYASLHFEEAVAETGSDPDAYRDSGLKNHMVGTDTANRLRAVFDLRVYEGWQGAINDNIFNDAEFLGGISSDDSDPIDNEYKIPIAAIYRHAGVSTILTADIIDLLTLYNKRVYNLEEITYRLRHGGYVAADVTERVLMDTGWYGYTGFAAQFPGAIVDEGAFATGLNQGIGTEALNSNAVTPRVLDSEGKFFVQGLQVGHATGIITYETGPEQLRDGEIVATYESLDKLYVGYGKRLTGQMGATGIRDYTNNISVYVAGTSGTAGLHMRSDNGETGSRIADIASAHDNTSDNQIIVDYRGRIGVNTTEPGWDGSPAQWGVTGTNVAVDINASARVREDVYVDGNAYLDGNTQGRTWNIPATLSNVNPALIGASGMVGVSGMVSVVLIKRGVAVAGETGITGYGYSGTAGQYECFDYDGRRLFTIGDLGDIFDRSILTPYGVGERQAFVSDYSFLYLPSGYGELQAGDAVTYDITVTSGDHVTGAITVTGTGWNAIEEVKEDIIYNPGWGNPTGLYRQFSYTWYGITGIDVPEIQTRTGEAWGVQILTNIYGVTGAGYTGAIDDNHGKLIIKDMTEDPVNVDISQIVSFTVSRGLLPTLNMTYTEFGYYGSGGYGGEIADYKFAKLDLGEAADAWLFNGDVYFNGVGRKNLTTFSSNVVMRNDVAIYGTLYADQLLFNYARVSNLGIDNDIIVDKYGQFKLGLIVGSGSSRSDFTTLHASNSNLLEYVKGDVQAQNLIAESESTDANVLGNVYLKSKNNNGKARVQIGGTIGAGSTGSVGIHVIDDRPGVSIDSTTSFKELVIDYGNGRGTNGNVDLNVKGDVTATRNLRGTYIMAGDVDAVNTDYALNVEGRGIVNGTLEVEALRFIGASSPDANSDILVPQNIAIVNESTLENQNNTNILREKKFTTTERIYLNNGSTGVVGVFPFPTGVTAHQDYYNNFIVTGDGGKWAHDTCTYKEREFEDTGIGNGTNEIIVDNVTLDAGKRYDFSRIIIATLGTVRMEWVGLAYGGMYTEDTTVNSYYFESPYFRNRDGGTVIDWMPSGARFGDDNLLVHVQGELIDTHASYPQMYDVNTSIGIYLPKDKWWCAKEVAVDADYDTFLQFYPYENTLSNFNIKYFNDVTLCGQGGFAVPFWRLGLYPRLVRQTRLPFTTANERMYQGEWDLDLVMFPEGVGRCANMIGKLYISYMQS